MNVPVRALVAILFLLSFSSPSFADTPSMTLAWDPVKDPAVTGYVLSYGTASRSYSKYVDVGKVTAFTVASLAHGTTYYFAVRAYDASGRLSAQSGEVSGTTKPLATGPDTTPNAFAFTARTGVTLSTVVPSSPVTISGINAPAPIAVSGGAVSINGGPFTGGPSTVTNGQTVVVRLTSSGSYARTVSATVTIGGVPGVFRVTTMAAPGDQPRDDEPRDDEVGDTTPDAFAFGRVTGAARNTAVTSNAIAVTGINASAPISISGGAFSVNGGSFRTGPATVTNGQTVVVRLTSSQDYGKEVEAALTIGGVAGVFRVATATAPVDEPHAGGLPASPTGLVATVRDDRTIQLTWDAVDDGVLGFRIEVGRAYGLADVSSFTTGITSRFTLSGLAPGTYYLRVRGVSEAGPGDPSDEVVASVDAPAQLPGMPIGLYYMIHNKSVIFVWAAPVDGGAPTSYVMEATDTKGNPLATIDTGNTMTFMVHDAGGAGTYVARIRAANSAGLGPASAPVTVVIPK